VDAQTNTATGIVIHRYSPTGSDHLADATEFSTIEKFQRVTNFVRASDRKQIRLMNAQVAAVIEYPNFTTSSFTTAEQIEALREQVKRNEDLTDRFPKSQALLSEMSKKIEASLQLFDQGKVLVAGRWTERSGMASPSDSVKGEELIITTEAGIQRTFSGVKVTGKTPDALRIMHSGGAATISFEELSKEDQAKYDFSEEEAQAFRQEEQMAKSQSESRGILGLSDEEAIARFGEPAGRMKDNGITVFRYDWESNGAKFGALAFFRDKAYSLRLVGSDESAFSSLSTCKEAAQRWGYRLPDSETENQEAGSAWLVNGVHVVQSPPSETVTGWTLNFGATEGAQTKNVSAAAVGGGMPLSGLRGATMAQVDAEFGSPSDTGEKGNVGLRRYAKNGTSIDAGFVGGRLTRLILKRAELMSLEDAQGIVEKYLKDSKLFDSTTGRDSSILLEFASQHGKGRILMQPLQRATTIIVEYQQQSQQVLPPETESISGKVMDASEADDSTADNPLEGLGGATEEQVDAEFGSPTEKGNKGNVSARRYAKAGDTTDAAFINGKLVRLIIKQPSLMDLDEAQAILTKYLPKAKIFDSTTGRDSSILMDFAAPNGTGQILMQPLQESTSIIIQWER